MNELAKIIERLAAIEAEQRGIHEAAGEKALNEETQLRWDNLDTEAAGLNARKAELEEAEARAARVADSRARFGASILPDRNTDPTRDLDSRALMLMSGDDLRERSARLLEDGRVNVRHLEDLPVTVTGEGDVREKVLKLTQTRNRHFNGEHFARLLLATENEHYRSAFAKLMTGVPHFTAEEGRALDAVTQLRAALNITTDGQGGFAVPVLIDPTVIWTAQGHPNFYWDIANVKNITTDEWKGITSAGATSYWATEGVATTGGEPTIAQPVVTTKKLTTWIKYSVEVGGDWVGFAGEMAEAVGLSWGDELVDKFTNGLGTTAQPYGIVTRLEATTASQVASDDSGTATAADVYRMWAALPIKYRSRSRWMANTVIENAIRQAGTQDPNFTVNMLAAGLPSLFNRPFHENDYMDGAVSSASDSSPLVLADFSGFVIANRVGMTVENVQTILDTTTGTPTGQRGAYFWGRVGSDLVNTNAARVLSQT